MAVVFTYGYAISFNWMKGIGSNPIKIGFGRLPNYELKRHGAWYVVPRQNSWVNGIVWEISDDALSRMDYIEAGYQRVQVKVELEYPDGQHFSRVIDCWLYRYPS